MALKMFKWTSILSQKSRVGPSTNAMLFLSQACNKKLVLREFGDPPKAVKLEEEEVKCPGDKEVLVEMIISPMNPADINSIQGTYPVKPSVNEVLGLEGVGRVVSVGSNVQHLAKDDIVIPSSPSFGSWQTHRIGSGDSFLKLPKNIPLVEAAGIASNSCTAYRMLKDFVPLKSGGTVIQNGANSAAGQNVIQLCKAWGITSVNIVRNRPDLEKLKGDLKDIGADVVLTEEELRVTKLFKNKELPPPQLALNCVGGKNAMEMMRHLAHQGIMVTYGGMSREPVTVPTSLFIFKDIAAKGYWMTRWSQKHKNTDLQKEMIDELSKLMIDGKLKPPAHCLIPLGKYLEALGNMSNPKGFTGVKYMIDFRL